MGVCTFNLDMFICYCSRCSKLISIHNNTALESFFHSSSDSEILMLVSVLLA